MDVKIQPTSTPFGPDNKAKHLQEVEANAAFKELDAVDQAPDAPGDQHTISREAIAQRAATALGVSQDVVDAALRQTPAETFNMDQFSNLVGSLQAPATELPTGPVLSKGGHNDPEQVKQLQQQLKDQNLYDGPIDGKFGPKTEEAVKAYQRSVNHVGPDGEPDGKAGPITMAALAKEAQAKDALAQQQEQLTTLQEAPPEVQQADTDAKIQEAEFDNEAFQADMKAAGDDPAKLKALADRLPETDARRDVLNAMASGQLSEGTAKHLRDAMTDQENTFGDFANALQESDGRAADFKAISDLAEAKVKVNPGAPETAKQLTQLAQATRIIAQAGDGVRQALAKGFDGSNNWGDYQAAADQIGSQADVAALKAFVDYTNAAETGKWGAPRTFTQNESGRLDTVAQQYDALKQNPEVWAQVQHSFRDNDWTGADLDNAMKAANGDAGLLGILGVLKTR